MIKNETIPFQEDQVKLYLDNCIDYWRERRDMPLVKPINLKDLSDRAIAICAVDCFQSVRTSLFGELKKGGVIGNKDGR